MKEVSRNDFNGWFFVTYQQNERYLVLREGLDPLAYGSLPWFASGEHNNGAQDITSGRGQVKVIGCQAEKLALRQYLRGGLVRKVSKDLFWQGPKVSSLSSLLCTRAWRETHILSLLCSKGVAVPQVMGFMIERVFPGVYRASLATRYIESASNLLMLCRGAQFPGDEPSIISAVSQAGMQARKMLDCLVMHTDLHPGNVLISSGPKPSNNSEEVLRDGGCEEGRQAILIDFDKAFVFKPHRQSEMVRRLVSRWSRSVKKNGLSPVLAAKFREILLET